ncbi:cold-shock protein [candidate division MSBL1 archaeon SCGC-AAA259I07]|uniref:Cold-shock protein n=2 Tax=candidate division MSBL1 TaxID=215777 RepID=A0A133U907_9EURY|nr:cold-shock protein [candidate division MSBL1 archaeon SCGC-AAA259B11]KXA95513.1 cold-shock protein [candidate division MSBL1 archaeon SCGC-AAA259I07]
MRGTVKFFDERKNYGFIEPDDGSEDLFVHRSEVDSESLEEGDVVEYEAEESEKGPRAVNVKKVE